jgi:hypothetical protein
MQMTVVERIRPARDAVSSEIGLDPAEVWGSVTAGVSGDMIFEANEHSFLRNSQSYQCYRPKDAQLLV